MTLAERFWSKVRKGPNCWEWTATRHRSGYGSFYVGRGWTTITGAPRKVVTALAHRVAYELEVGPIPVGLELDHLCGNTGCVRPSHLEPVTRDEHAARGETTGYGRRQSRNKGITRAAPTQAPAGGGVE